MATLLAVGYTAAQVRDQMRSISYHHLLGQPRTHIPFVRRGKVVRPRMEYLAMWIGPLLHQKGVTTFGDLRYADPMSSSSGTQYRLMFIAWDSTRRALVRFPQDYSEYGLEADQQDVISALMATVATPGFFEPLMIHDSAISAAVDTVALDEHLLEVFDRADRKAPRWPTFGIRMVRDDQLLVHERPSVDVPDLGVKPTGFNMTVATQDGLYDAGRRAAEAVFGV